MARGGGGGSRFVVDDERAAEAAAVAAAVEEAAVALSASWRMMVRRVSSVRHGLPHSTCKALTLLPPPLPLPSWLLLLLWHPIVPSQAAAHPLTKEGGVGRAPSPPPPTLLLLLLSRASSKARLADKESGLRAGEAQVWSTRAPLCFTTWKRCIFQR
jgi:hypothetical protein